MFLISLTEKMEITWRDIGIGFAAELLMETSRILLSYGISIGLAAAAPMQATPQNIRRTPMM